jgi:hypothetical protein
MFLHFLVNKYLIDYDYPKSTSYRYEYLTVAYVQDFALGYDVSVNSSTTLHSVWLGTLHVHKTER